MKSNILENQARRLIAALVENDADDFLVKAGISKPYTPPAPKPVQPPTRRERELVHKGNYLEPEEEHGEDADDILHKYIDQERLRFEGESGVRSLETLASVLGYHGLDEFLADNPGACDAIVNFIDEWVPRTVHHENSWYDRLKRAVNGEEADPDLD